MRHIRRVTLVFAIMLSAAAAFSEGRAEEPARVLATTGWTAAFVRAAGIPDVGVLAPYDMSHPPEYELTPSDIRAVNGAELVVYAGYENMVSRLKDLAGGGDTQLLQITTENSLEVIRESVMKVARALGTEQAASENLRRIEALYRDWKAELRDLGVYGAPVLVHAFQRPLIADLGFDIAGVFGPAPLEAAQIGRLSQAGATLIIDNLHNPVAAPLAETIPGARMAVLRNFPESARRGNLMDILEDNRSRLRRIMKK